MPQLRRSEGPDVVDMAQYSAPSRPNGSRQATYCPS